MIDATTVLCTVAGFLLGILCGLLPGIHVNTVAAVTLAASPTLLVMGLQPHHLAVMVLCASISQTFLDSIPAIFVGAPDSEMVMAVLPGHRMMMEGRGIEAVRLSAIGSAGSVVLSFILMIPIAVAFGAYYSLLIGYFGWILLALFVMMIATESGPALEGRGSLSHIKYKLLAVLLFLTSGLLGQFAFDHEALVSSQLGEDAILMPLLSGMFGASFLVISLLSKTTVPEQRDTGLNLPLSTILRSVLIGGLAGSIIAWIPGVSPAVATSAARIGGSGRETDGEEFLVSISGVNTSSAVFSLVALYVIGRPRSGAAAAIEELTTLDQGLFLLCLASVAAVAAASYVATIMLAGSAAVMLGKINYRMLCFAVLVGLLAVSVIMTGLYGGMIFLISTMIGLVAPLSGIRKTHAMGVLMLPLIIYYLG